MNQSVKNKYIIKTIDFFYTIKKLILILIMVSICVKTINGKSYNYEININSKINDLKERILHDVGTPIEYQYLSYKGILLQDDKFLYNYLKKTKFTYYHILNS